MYSIAVLKVASFWSGDKVWERNHASFIQQISCSQTDASNTNLGNCLFYSQDLTLY